MLVVQDESNVLGVRISSKLFNELRQYFIYHRYLVFANYNPLQLVLSLLLLQLNLLKPVMLPDASDRYPCLWVRVQNLLDEVFAVG